MDNPQLKLAVDDFEVEFEIMPLEIDDRRSEILDNIEQLDEIEEDVDAIEKNIDEVEENIDEIEKNIDEVEEDVEENKADIQKNLDKINDLIAEVAALKNAETEAEKNIAQAKIIALVSGGIGVVSLVLSALIALGIV